jgi:hypothetical protein
VKRLVYLLLFVSPVCGCGDRSALSPAETDSIALAEEMLRHEAALKRIQDSLDTIPVPEPVFAWLNSKPFVPGDYKDRFRHPPLGKKMKLARESCDTTQLVRMTMEDYYTIFREEPADYNRKAQHYFYSMEDRPGKEYYAVTVLRYFSPERAELVLVNISRDGLKADDLDVAGYYYEGPGIESGMSKSFSTVSASGRVVLDDNYFAPNYDFDRYKDFTAENFLGEVTRYRFILEPAADGTFDQVETHSWKTKAIGTDDIDEKLFY